MKILIVLVSSKLWYALFPFKITSVLNFFKINYLNLVPAPIFWVPAPIFLTKKHLIKQLRNLLWICRINDFFVALALECYSCSNQDGNKDKCVKTSKQCEQNQDACTSYIRWASECAQCCYSFTHSGHFYSASSSPLLLRGAPDYSTDTVSEFHAEAHRQL